MFVSGRPIRPVYPIVIVIDAGDTEDCANPYRQSTLPPSKTISSESTGTVLPLQFAAVLKWFGPLAAMVVAVETVPDVLDFDTVIV